MKHENANYCEMKAMQQWLDQFLILW